MVYIVNTYFCTEIFITSLMHIHKFLDFYMLLVETDETYFSG